MGISSKIPIHRAFPWSFSNLRCPYLKVLQLYRGSAFLLGFAETSMFLYPNFS